MRLFYFKEKPTTPLPQGNKNMKKHTFQWKNVFVRRFLLKWKLLKHLWKLKKIQDRSSQSQMFCKIDILKNFTNFTQKMLCLNHFLINPDSLLLYLEETPTQVFSCEIWKNFKNINFSGKMNAWLRNCRSILAFLKREIKDRKRETKKKMHGEQFSSF